MTCRNSFITSSFCWGTSFLIGIMWSRDWWRLQATSIFEDKTHEISLFRPSSVPCKLETFKTLQQTFRNRAAILPLNRGIVLKLWITLLQRERQRLKSTSRRTLFSWKTVNKKTYINVNVEFSQFRRISKQPDKQLGPVVAVERQLHMFKVVEDSANSKHRLHTRQ